MPQRREFLTALSAMGVAVIRPANWGYPVQSVTAQPTVFHGHPEGRTTLVRFTAYGIDVPAGRLRIYDNPRRDLLGTAGMLRLGEVLYGELWLPLERRRTVTSELEVPGRRGIIRHQHTLTPQPHWTIYWLTIADPEALRHDLDNVDPWRRGVRAALYAAAGVRANPLSETRSPAASDHVEILRRAIPARELEADLGIPTSPLALIESSTSLEPVTVAVLAGSGVRVLAVLESSDLPIQVLEIPGSSPLPVIAAPAIRDPATLGFGASQAEMVTSIERWLTATSAFHGAGFPANVVVVVGNDHTVSPAYLAAARSWNGRFAFPHIVVGADPDHLLREVGAGRSVRAASTGRRPLSDPASLADIAAMREARDGMTQKRATTLFAPLVSLLGGAVGDLEVVARGVAPRFAGTVVLNTSPFTRTDVLRRPDGREEIVTDVPGLGYAFVIGPAEAVRAVDGVTGWERVPQSEHLTGQAFRVSVNAATGAIERLVDTTGRAWVRAGSGGVNEVPEVTNSTLTRELLANVGTRITVVRQLRGGGMVRSRYTVYDTLPWLDIENLGEHEGNSPIEYRFSFALERPAVSWERPVGSVTQLAPVGEFVHLRWIRFQQEGRSVLFRGYHTPVASVSQDGMLINLAPPGIARFRLLFDGMSLVSPWRFGWDSEPLHAVPASPGGSGLLPSAGSLFTVDQDEIAVLGVKPADDGDGLIAFLQDVKGEPRLVSLQPGLLRFREARRVDFVERDIGSVDGTLDEGVIVRMAGNQIVALRLRGLWLAGG